jgi:hypothetical protein
MSIDILFERFKATPIEPKIVDIYQSEYLFTTLIQNLYASSPVHVHPDVVTTEFKQFKAILHLDRYIKEVHSVEGMKETITLLSSYLRSELKEFCSLYQTPIYIGSPLIPTCGEDNIIRFGFTYTANGTMV